MSESVSPYQFDAPLAVCIDFRNPNAWLAIEPTCALAAKLGIGIEWLPRLVVPPAPPRAPNGAEDRGARHRRVRAEYFARDVERYASARGYELKKSHEDDGIAPALGLMHVRAVAPARTQVYVVAAYDAIWVQDRAADSATVGALLTGLGVDSSGFEARQSELRAMDASLAAAGVHGVPGYVVADELFVGRAHLPMIEWLLTGRTGVSPI